MKMYEGYDPGDAPEMFITAKEKYNKEDVIKDFRAMCYNEHDNISDDSFIEFMSKYITFEDEIDLIEGWNKRCK